MKIVLRNGQFRLETNDGRFIQRVQTVTLIREDGTRQKFALAIRPRRGFTSRGALVEGCHDMDRMLEDGRAIREGADA